MRRRALGWGLILYGIAGLVLIVSGAIAGIDAAARIKRLAGDADVTLASAARATRTAAESFGNIDASLTEAQASAEAGATLARDASATLQSMAVAMELSIFGAQPLLPLAGEFNSSADQASGLALTLDAVASSLNDTRTDVAGVGRELGLLADQLEGLRGSADPDPATAPPLRLFVGLLLAWLAIPAIGGIVGGVAVLRRPPPSVVIVEQPVSPPGGGPAAAG